MAFESGAVLYSLVAVGCLAGGYVGVCGGVAGVCASSDLSGW